jgi:hypothetical protein
LLELHTSDRCKLSIENKLDINLEAYSKSRGFCGWMGFESSKSIKTCTEEIIEVFRCFGEDVYIVSSLFWIDEGDSRADETHLFLKQLIDSGWLKRMSADSWDALASQKKEDPRSDQFREGIINKDFWILTDRLHNPKFVSSLLAVLDLKACEFVVIGHLFFYWKGNGLLAYPHEHRGFGLIASQSIKKEAIEILKKFEWHEIPTHKFIPLPQFKLAWRWTNPKYAVLPADVLKQIRPLTGTSAQDIAKNGKVQWRRGDPSVGLRTASKGKTFKADEHAAATFEKLPIKDQVEIFVFWNDDTAVITTWGVFAHYWDDFCYPGGEDMLIWSEGATWSLSYSHEEFFTYRD